MTTFSFSWLPELGICNLQNKFKIKYPAGPAGTVELTDYFAISSLLPSCFPWLRERTAQLFPRAICLQLCSLIKPFLYRSAWETSCLSSFFRVLSCWQACSFKSFIWAFTWWGGCGQLKWLKGPCLTQYKSGRDVSQKLPGMEFGNGRIKGTRHSHLRLGTLV